MSVDVNALKKEISISEKDGSKQRVESFFNKLEQGTASFTDQKLARLERIIVEKRGRAAAHVVVAPIDTAQPSNPQLRCSEISFDVHVYMEENIDGKMEPELGQLELSSADTGFEAPGEQCLSNWEMERTTVDGYLLVSENQVIVIFLRAEAKGGGEKKTNGDANHIDGEYNRRASIFLPINLLKTSTSWFDSLATRRGKDRSKLSLVTCFSRT